MYSTSSLVEGEIDWGLMNDQDSQGTEEEYYARRARIERRYFNNRTGRRTRRRSGPGPPDPNRRIPFNPDALMNADNPEISPVQQLHSPNFRRRSSRFVFGEPATITPFYEPGSLLSQLDAQQEDNRVTVQLGTVAGSAEGSSSPSPRSPTPSTLNQCEHTNQEETVNSLESNEPILNENEVIITKSISPAQTVKQTGTFKSKLTRYLERKMSGKPRLTEMLVSNDVSASDKMKMEVARALVCCRCKSNFAPPVSGCIHGHPMCILCQKQCAVAAQIDKQPRFRCPTCGEISVPVEMKQVDDLLQDFKYVCYCGLKVNGSRLAAHRNCASLKHEMPKHVLVCEDYGANSCELCEEEIIYSKYVDHLFKAHFLRSFPELSNGELIKMPKEVPLFQCELRLPLEPASGKMSILPSAIRQTIAESEDGKFSIHQVRFEEKQLTWCLSYEVHPEAAKRICVAKFQARLQFEAVVKNNVYKKTCNALIYPFGKGMDENLFLELVGRALPDAWTPTFKFAYTHKTSLHLQIFRCTGKYVRRFGRTLAVDSQCGE